MSAVPEKYIDHPSDADRDPLDFTWGVDCGRFTKSEWCFYQEPHNHGFDCDKTCICRAPTSHGGVRGANHQVQVHRDLAL